MKGLVLVNGGGGAAASVGGLLCGMMRVSSIRSRASWTSPVDIESDRTPATQGAPPTIWHWMHVIGRSNGKGEPCTP